MNRALGRIVAGAVVGWLGVTGAGAQTRLPPRQQYLLRVTKDSSLDRVCTKHGLVVLRPIGMLRLYIVAGPADIAPDALVADVRSDSSVLTFEPDYIADTGMTAAAHPDLHQTTESLDDALAVDRTAINFHGALAWTGYVRQPALRLMNLRAPRRAAHGGKDVIVAVIDSGVDPGNPVLKDVLLPGYDFTRNQPGASEWPDLAPELTDVLGTDSCAPQSDPASGSTTTGSIAPTCVAGVVSQSSAAILDSDTITALTGVTLPPGFGHGTMVAGLIHAVAPRAKILPVKAFNADGTGRSSDIAQAIYYAIEQGARVINMSFTFDTVSDEVMYATAWAALQGRILVAAAGNEGLITRRWPAEHKWVVGVGSTNLADVRSSFSNQGYSTFKIGAPGENLVTTFPAGLYAAVSGTSFSAPLMSGAAALMSIVAPKLDWGACSDVVAAGQYAPITDVVRNDANAFPQRLAFPPAVELAPVLQRDSVKQINNIH